jgi:hypothetical protein
MGRKKTRKKEVEEPIETKTTNQTGVAPNVDSADKKYRLTFLVSQSFRGQYYTQGSYLENVPHGIYKAYKGRSTLKFEQI